VKQFNYCASVIAINNGNGQFTVQKLPAELQLSSICAVHCTDLDDDGKPDIILGGNEFGFLPQFERLDAGRGAVLLNKGKAEFRLLDAEESGVDLEGQIRDIKEIKGAIGKQILFLRNDMFPVLFRMKKNADKNTALQKSN
jgi:hypothetical protein